MLGLGRSIQRRSIGIIRTFSSGQVPPKSKYVKPKPGAGQTEDLDEKTERLRQSISRLKEESAKQSEAAEEKVADLVEKRMTKKDV